MQDWSGSQFNKVSTYPAKSDPTSGSASPSCLLTVLPCMQEWNEIQFNGVYYAPPKQGAPGAEPDFDTSYTFNYPRPKRPENLRIYECHVGMSSEEPKVGHFVLLNTRVRCYAGWSTRCCWYLTYSGSGSAHVTCKASSLQLKTLTCMESACCDLHRRCRTVLQDSV